MKPQALRFGPAPAVAPDVYWVETVDAGKCLRFMSYSPKFWGVWTHYEGRTLPCYEDTSFCEGGHDDSTCRWYGYLFGHLIEEKKTCFLQLTRACHDYLMSTVAPNSSLRGVTIQVRRTASKKGRVKAMVFEWPPPGKRDYLPPDVDPTSTLMHLWELDVASVQPNVMTFASPDNVPLPETA